MSLRDIVCLVRAQDRRSGLANATYPRRVLTLYDFPASPHCVRVRLALAFAGARYRTIAMKLDGDQKRPAFRKLSPLGTVPVLVDGRVAIPESYAALAWLAERFPSLLPKSGAARARAWMWLAIAATEIDPPVRAAYDEAFFTKRPDAARVRAALVRVRAAFDRVEKARAEGRPPACLASAAPTIADAALLPSLWLARDLEADFPREMPRRRWPKLDAWYTHLRARPEAARVFDEAEA